MAKIGILDSGVGGLSILGTIRKQLPAIDILYLADTANFPYGEKASGEVGCLTEQGISRLAQTGVDAIVVACNTASVNGLDRYQKAFPDQKLVGVTPLLDQATKATKTGKIVLLATFATIASDYLHDIQELVARDITVYAHAAFEWVRMVEAGEIDDKLVAEQVATFARYGVDVAVLGCTHFAFLAPTIKQAVPDLVIIEPGPTIAAALAEMVENEGESRVEYLVTGDVVAFNRTATKLLGYPVVATANQGDHKDH